MDNKERAEKGKAKTLPDKNPVKKKPRLPVQIEWHTDNTMIHGWQAFVYSLPQEYKEHDGWSLRENNAVVSDGATPLSEDWGGDLYHWVNTTSALFAEYGKDINKNLKEVWKESIAFSNSIFPPLGFKRTMGTSHIRFNNHIIEALTVGDTKIVLRKIDGNFIELFDTRLSQWEYRADALIDEGLLTGKMAAWHNRLKANTLGGYYVVSDNPHIANKALEYQIEEYKIDSIILCSDGLWRLFEGNPDLLFKSTNPKNPESLKARLEKNGNLSDDLTFIRLDKN